MRPGLLYGRRAVASGAPEDGDSEPEAPRVTTGSKVISLAEEIAALEHKYDFLQERNKVLMGKVMQLRSSIAGRSIWGNDRVRKRRAFTAWRAFAQDLSLENQLDKQTLALDECQQVARELGRVLADEQEARRAADQVARSTREEIRAVLSNTESLQEEMAAQAEKMQMLERQLREADVLISQSRADALAVIRHADEYEKAMRELERRAKDGRRLPKSPYEDSEDVHDKFEHGQKVREEAAGAVKNARAMLLPGLRPSHSPERERPSGRPPHPVPAVQAASASAPQLPPRQPAAPAPSQLAAHGWHAPPPAPALAPLTELPRQESGERPGAWVARERSPLQHLRVGRAVVAPPAPSSPSGGGSPTHSHSFGYHVQAASGPRLLQQAPSQAFPASPLGPCHSPLAAASPFAHGYGAPGPSGQALEPWWCVRPVGPSGRATATPQAPHM